MSTNVTFMGTPAFSVPTLNVLAGRVSAGNLLVVTQPNRKAGRGRRVQAPAVKVAAEDLGIGVVQTDTMKDDSIRERLTAFAPDLIVVAAFGLILPAWVLKLPRLGCVNLHASDLPRFRGASPVAAAIAMGDARTAVALMEMERGLDTGAVLAKRYIDINSDATTESLTTELGLAGAALVDRSLTSLLQGELRATPQSGTVIETRKITKADGEIDWRRSASVIERHVRAMWSWPRAWTEAGRELRLQVHKAEVATDDLEGSPGRVLAYDQAGMLMATGEGVLRLVTVQLPGRGPERAAAMGRVPELAVGAMLDRERVDELSVSWIVETGEA